MNAQIMAALLLLVSRQLMRGTAPRLRHLRRSRWTRHSGGPEYPRARSAGLPAADSLNQHLTDLGVAAESQLGCCANEALRKGPVLRIRSEDEY